MKTFEGQRRMGIVPEKALLGRLYYFSRFHYFFNDEIVMPNRNLDYNRKANNKVYNKLKEGPLWEEQEETSALKKS